MTATFAESEKNDIAMMKALAAKKAAVKRPFYRKLYVQVLIAVALGAALGHYYPSFAVPLKPYGDAFIRAITVVVAPIIFTTIVVGIAKMGDIRRVATVGLKALIYFEVASTIALIIGMFVGNVVQPRMQGRSLNIDFIALLLALAFWSVVWGLPGAFLSTPLTTVMMVMMASSQATIAALACSHSGVSIRAISASVVCGVSSPTPR